MNYNITDTTIAEPCASSMILSRPLKSTHLRDIARKQCPADFFNK